MAIRGSERVVGMEHVCQGKAGTGLLSSHPPSTTISLSFCRESKAPEVPLARG